MIPWYNVMIVWNGMEMSMIQRFQLDIKAGGSLVAIIDNCEIPIYHFEVEKTGKDHIIYIESY